MLPNKINLKKSLNKAYYKQSLKRCEIELFKENLNKLYKRINEKESEEHLKNIIADFLKDTFYSNRFEINTKDRIDLAIHNGKTSKDSVGVILEVKRPTSNERVTLENLNCKALHELVLYYFDERNEDRNIEIKQLIATSVHEWFIFDENEFDKTFYRNTKLQKLYKAKNEQSKDNPFFYTEAQKIISELENEISFTYFNLKDFEKAALNEKNNDDDILIELYKILSPEHLLKLPFTNDSNSLNKEFYNELLHIIGLEETKDGSKKLITRKKPENRDDGSLLENTINMLRSEGCLENIQNLDQYGDTQEERLFSIGLELCITWLNRILFLKLLEGQLISYHKGNRDYTFLNAENIHDFDELNELFFEVLAVRPSERTKIVNQKFGNIPYLNSSLFERAELETRTIRINSLKDRFEIPIYKHTVIKENNGKSITGTNPTLVYLFNFLDAYDFASESSAKIQEQNKSIINASVLGLIFEKINGYKDGSFFTPGFITMYMCRETIRRAIIQKFNEQNNWDITEFIDLKDKIEYKDKAQRNEANKTINSLKICDPAVGSGHFLVSALNEIIAIKSELGILQYRDGSRVQGFKITIENDELIIIDEENDVLFNYAINQSQKPITELQKLQEALFHEKETIIEECLFGVDINPKSVMICRLRLWIELLKNAYYTENSKYTELETLPNIDINIKTGNSLISRFPLDADLSKALKSIKYDIKAYRGFVNDYKNANDKEQKKGLLQIINSIKSDFRSEIQNNDPKLIKLNKLGGELFSLLNQKQIFEPTAKEKATQKQQKEKLETDINKLSTEVEDIKNNAIYRNALEWRFEFPEVLDEKGDFKGFDVIIGNPPYIFGGNEGISTNEKIFFKNEYISGSGKINLFTLFIEKSFSLLKNDAKFSFIIPNTFLRVTSYHESRKLLIENHKVICISDFGDSVFDDAITTAIVLIAEKSNATLSHKVYINANYSYNEVTQTSIKDANYVISTNLNSEKSHILNKLNINTVSLGSICREMIFGIVITKNKDEVVSDKQIEGWKPFLEGKDIGAYYIKPIHSYLNYEPKLLHRARSIDIFEANEKILIQRITGGNKPLKAAYDNNKFYNKESINNIILNDKFGFNIKYILSLLNSKLINWFYVNRFTNESNLTVNLSKEYLSQIPVAKLTKEQEQALVEKVNQIISIKESNYLIDTNSIENEIDLIIYKIYGLSANEMKIVEGLA